MARAFLIHDAPSPHVLKPWNPREAVSVATAARMIGCSVATMRRHVARFDLGRRIGGGHWRVSRVALRMFAENDASALQAYHDGRRDDPVVRRYLDDAGLGPADDK